jgi:hypothetical protein
MSEEFRHSCRVCGESYKGTYEDLRELFAPHHKTRNRLQTICHDCDARRQREKNGKTR